MKAVRIRVAVAVDKSGNYSAIGWNQKTPEKDPERLLSDSSMLEAFRSDERLSYCWVEADVPAPAPPPVVEGEARFDALAQEGAGDA